MISYLKSQSKRLNFEQRSLVERLAKLPEDQWQKLDRERLALLYTWLHSEKGSVEHRRFPSTGQSPTRRRA